MTGIERLNAAFKASPDAVKALLHHTVPCPPELEPHVFHREMPDGSRTVTLIGLLNGTLFREGDRIAYETNAPREASREEEVSAIIDYALVPAEKFNKVPPNGAGSQLEAVL